LQKKARKLFKKKYKLRKMF